MRHTLTLEPDVDERLARICKESGETFKVVVNETLRLGLTARLQSKDSPPLEIIPLSGGPKPGVSLVSISALEGMIEEESYK